MGKSFRQAADEAEREMRRLERQIMHAGSLKRPSARAIAERKLAEQAQRVQAACRGVTVALVNTLRVNQPNE